MKYYLIFWTAERRPGGEHLQKILGIFHIFHTISRPTKLKKLQEICRFHHFFKFLLTFLMPKM